VKLTAAGRVFLSHPRQAVKEIERGQQAAARPARGETGQLLLGLPSSGNSKLYTEVLGRFSERFSKIHLVFKSLSATEKIEAIKQSNLDAGFLRMPVYVPQLELRIISRETLIVALPANHPLAAKESIRLVDLSDVPSIMFPRRLAPDFYDTTVSVFRQCGQKLRIEQKAEHFQVRLSMIAGGFGMSLIPSSAQHFQLAGVTYRRIADPVPVVETATGYRRNDCSEALNSLLDVFGETRSTLGIGSSEEDL